MIDLQQFKMNPAEEQLLRGLISKSKPNLVAEFGSGLTTKLWAEASKARIVSWDNFPEWLHALRAHFASEPWFCRVEFRLYSVQPDCRRDIEKEPAPWEDGKFDFLFLDGPRSAHPPNPGRSGSFRFAVQHAAEGALIVWHDAERPHEKEMARQYFGHCRRSRQGRVGWCLWHAPRGGFKEWLCRINPFT